MRIKSQFMTTLLITVLASIIPLLSFANDEQVRKDLAAVLALKGHPCGEIVTLDKKAENDYLVACKDGRRYRIFIDAEDRVIVEARN